MTTAKLNMTTAMYLTPFSPILEPTLDARLTNVLYTKGPAPHLLRTAIQFGLKAAT